MVAILFTAVVELYILEILLFLRGLTLSSKVPPRPGYEPTVSVVIAASFAGWRAEHVLDEGLEAPTKGQKEEGIKATPRSEEVRFDEESQMVLDGRGMDYSAAETDEAPEYVLEEVSRRLEEFGLEVVLGDDGVNDYVYFRIERKRK